MKFRVISVLLFFVCLFSAFFYFRWEETFSMTKTPPADIQQNQENVAEDYEQWWNNHNDVLESRLPYQKKMAFIHVGELNLYGLRGNPIGNLVENQMTFNEKTKAMYFYEGAPLPRKEDNLIVMYDVNVMDVQIGHNIISAEKSIRLPFSEISAIRKEPDTYTIVNEERPFLNHPMDIQLVNDQGDVEITFNEETRHLKAGETAMFEKNETQKGKVLKAKVAVTNYGMWDTTNMKFRVERPKQ